MEPYRATPPPPADDLSPRQSRWIVALLGFVAIVGIRIAMTAAFRAGSTITSPKEEGWQAAFVLGFAVLILAGKAVYGHFYQRWVAREVARKMAELDAPSPRTRIALPDAHEVRPREGAEADLGEELGEAHHRHVR